MGHSGTLNQSEFQPMAEVSFPVLISPSNTKEKIPLLAGKIKMLHNEILKDSDQLSFIIIII